MGTSTFGWKSRILIGTISPKIWPVVGRCAGQLTPSVESQIQSLPMKPVLIVTYQDMGKKLCQYCVKFDKFDVSVGDKGLAAERTKTDRK